ncbi:22578_t:CDS:2 [Rhizophagus irregularis]|nr:22578_t:CDS:2 [Rhizophagus irregularis]
MVSLHEVYTIKIWWKPVQFPWCTPDFNEVSSFCGNVMEILFTDRRDMVSLHEVYTIKIWWKPVQFPWCTPDFNEVSSFCGNVMEILCKLDTYTKISIVESIPLRPV